MALKNRFISDESGASLLLIALMIPLLLTIVGMTIDLSKLYAVQSKAQSAMDAGLLGAVSTASTTAVQAEALRLFNANYPNKYMGSTVSAFSVTGSAGNYTGSAQVLVPNSMMQMFGFTNTTLNIVSKVLDSQNSSTLEIAMVLDNSNGVDVPNLVSSSKLFINTLFGANATLANTYVSVLPYDVAVNVTTSPAAKLLWAQNQAQYVAYGGGGGNAYFAGRNPDIPKNALYNDVSDTPPGAAVTTQFRTPYGAAPGTFNNGDGVNTALTKMLFGSNVQGTILTTLQGMQMAGRTRTNVGLMWGWFTLSTSWTGRWDASLPGLPMGAGSTRNKVVILVSGQKNNVYLGGNQTCGAGLCAVSNDNTTTAALCTAIKAQGMRIYTIGFGLPGTYNAAQLNTCSSGSGYYFATANAAQLNAAYQTIVDSLKFTGIRLSQ